MAKALPLGIINAPWSPNGEWEGEDAICIGGGPSLRGFDFSVLRGRNTIGCNDAFRLGADIVKVLAFGDNGWWHRNKFEIEEKFKGHMVTSAPGLFRIQIRNCLRMVREKDGYHTGHSLGWNYSTGAMAINFAGSLGAKRIFLLGYDLMQRQGRFHWHDHGRRKVEEASYTRFLQGFYKLKKNMPSDIRVINVTDGSKLTAFEVMSFEDFHKELQEAVLA